MDEYIVKHLLKKNKEMSKSEAEKRAVEIWDAYTWAEERDSWLESVGEETDSVSSTLSSLSL